MKYRVITGGFWRHGTIHIEGDYLDLFSSESSGRQLYTEMTDFLIANSHAMGCRLDFWPEFFGIYFSEGHLDFMVGEEDSVWFVPEDSEHYKSPAPAEGAMESWLHAGDLRMNFEDVDWDAFPEFWDLYPEGHPDVIQSLPGSNGWEVLRPYYEKRRKEKLANFLQNFGKIEE